MANPDHAGPFLKPSPLDTAIRKHARKRARQAVKTEATRDRALRLSALRRACYMRDAGRCRAYGVPLKLITDNPELLAHAHHLVYRSAGGGDEMSNLVTLSPRAHRDEHEHRLVISGDPSGTLTFVERNLETGKVIRMWESTVGVSSTRRPA